MKPEYPEKSPTLGRWPVLMIPEICKPFLCSLEAFLSLIRYTVCQGFTFVPLTLNYDLTYMCSTL